MAGEPRSTESASFAPSARGRRLRIVDGRTVRARTWLLALVLLLAGGVAVLGLRLALEGVADEPPPPAPAVGSAPR